MSALVRLPQVLTFVESRAICYYIASKYADQGPKLLPDAADIKGNAMFQQWASVERDNWDKYAHPMIFEKIIKVSVKSSLAMFEIPDLGTDLTRLRNLHGSSPDLKVLKDNEVGFVPKLDVFENILSKQQYMGGNEFSLIDIYYVPYTQKLFEAGYGHLITDRSHINAWWERVSGRKSWQEVLALP